VIKVNGYSGPSTQIYMDRVKVSFSMRACAGGPLLNKRLYRHSNIVRTSKIAFESFNTCRSQSVAEDRNGHISRDTTSLHATTFSSNFSIGQWHNVTPSQKTKRGPLRYRDEFILGIPMGPMGPTGIAREWELLT